VIEALGDQKVVYFSSEKNTFIGKLEAHLPVSTGHRMEVAFNASKIHIFDPNSEINLTCTAAKYEVANLADLPQAVAATQ